MEYITIDKKTKKAIYLQIADSIRQAILSGRLKDMDRLPTEKELCDFFEISDIVVKRAYGELVEDQIVERIQGSGTFVATRKKMIFPIIGFKNVSEPSFAYQSKFKRILLFDVDKNNKAINLILGNSYNEDLYKAKYVVYIDKTPVLIQTLYLTKKDFDSLSISMLLENNLFTLLEDQFHFQIEHAKSKFFPVILSSAETILLNIHKDSAAHLVRTTFYTSQKPIAYIETLFPGLYTQFEVSIL